MDKKKQIEEMAKEINKGFDMAYTAQSSDFPRFIASVLVEKYQPKTPEDVVVLTREEYTNYIVEYLGIKDIQKQIRKETAEKFAERLKAQYPPRTDRRCTLDDCYMLDKIDEIAKEFTGGNE